MVSKKTLIFFVVLLLFIPEKFHCKFEKIEQYLVKYEISNSTELKRKVQIKFPTIENAEKSIEIKGFGKTFILDIFIYFHHEDASIEYISKELNSTGRFQDLKAFLYQGNVRDTKGSFVLGFFTQDKLFRGYFMTDEVYCVEPHEDKKSVILYKLRDVIFPGCSKTAKADGLDCSKTKYYEPWKPSKSRLKVKFDNRVLHDEYLQRFSGIEYQKDKIKTYIKKENDSDGINNSDKAKDDYETAEKEKNTSTVNTKNDDFKDKKHHTGTGNELGNENNDHHKNKYDEKKVIKMVDANQPNSTVYWEENSSEKYKENKDELERWLATSNGNYSDINNTNGHVNENSNDWVNKTHSATDSDSKDDGEKSHRSKYSTDFFHINLSSMELDLTHASYNSELYNMSHVENATNISFERSQNFTESSKTIESAGKVLIKEQINSQGDRKYNIKEINSINEELSVNPIPPNENFSTNSSDRVTSAGLNSILHNTVNLENNSDNFNDISILKTEEKENESANFSHEKKSIQKRQYSLEEFDIPYASIERFDMDPVEMECSLGIFISPEFRKKFDNQDADAIKDIFTQITLVNKLFQKVVLKRKGLPFHANFRISELVVYRDKTFSPFEMKEEMEDVVRYFNLQKRSCLSIGLMNKILKGPLEFVDGYLPKDKGGGACARFGNFFVVSHGDEETPAPMGLYLAALVRGFSRGFGATDEGKKCQEGDLPNPLQELRDNLLAKQITPGNSYSVFSKCNLQDIEKGLKHRKCLVELKDPLCGNAIIDEGEECDCGPSYICQKLDPCCKPHLTAEEKLNAWLKDKSIPQSCILDSKAQCGMSQPCCDNCFVRPGVEKLCYYGTGLCDQAYCDGKHAICPSSAKDSEGLVCDEFNTTKQEPVLCKNKQCEFGLCSGFGLTPCVCPSETGKECVTCCQKDGKCQAAVSELHLIKGEDFPRLNQANCTGGLCFRGKCVLEARIQANNASDKNPASLIRNNKILMALNSIFMTVITFSVLLFML